jgi:hypothetical protein
MLRDVLSDYWAVRGHLWRAALLGVLLVAVVPFLKGGGGLTFDGSTDSFSCGTAPNFDVTENYVNIVVWFAPNWPNTDTGTQYTILDAWAAGAPSTGYRFYWNTAGDLRWEAGDTVSFDPASCTVPQSSFGPGLLQWSAGDLLGAFFSIANNVQNCQLFNPETVRSASGSSFGSFGMSNGTNTLVIGADSAGANYFDGDLFLILLTNSRINSLGTNRLTSLRKTMFFPMYQAQPSVQSIAPDPIAAWMFERGNVGTSLSSGDVMFDVTGGGTDCTVDTGATPLAVGTLMQP